MWLSDKEFPEKRGHRRDDAWVCVHMFVHNGLVLCNSSAVKKHSNRWTQSHTWTCAWPCPYTFMSSGFKSSHFVFPDLFNIHLWRGRKKSKYCQIRLRPLPCSGINWMAWGVARHLKCDTGGIFNDAITCAYQSSHGADELAGPASFSSFFCFKNVNNSLHTP